MRRTALVLITLVAASAVLCRSAVGYAEPCFDRLPPGWRVTKSVVASPDQLSMIQQRLGGRLDKVSNSVLIVHGTKVQVNVLHGHTRADAEKVYKAILKMKTHPAYCLCRGTEAIEFCGSQVTVALATKAAYELGFKAKPTQLRYRVRAEIAPIDQCHYMSFNELFGQFLILQQKPGDKGATDRIHNLVKRFRFGDRIMLRSCGPQGGNPSYRFEPQSVGAQRLDHGDATRYTFTDLPKRLGVPYVCVTADITAREGGLTPASRRPGPELLSATEFWPVDDPEVVSLAKSITQGRADDAGKVAAILDWLKPGRNIKFGGPVRGSRWGVKTVLKQRYGHCWDSSDCFVTFCRAVGVPARQVGGWLYGCSGHIWAEVLLPGKGWWQVDPTGGTLLKCGIYHIPYFVSEDGHMPILYVSMPQIEISGD